MSKYGEITALLNWAMSQKDKPAKTPRVKKEKEKNVFEQLMEMQQNLTLFQQFLKDQEKLGKKEEKKKDEGMSVVHLTMMFIILSTLTGPLNVYMIGRMLGKW